MSMYDMFPLKLCFILLYDTQASCFLAPHFLSSHSTLILPTLPWSPLPVTKPSFIPPAVCASVCYAAFSLMTQHHLVATVTMTTWVHLSLFINRPLHFHNKTTVCVCVCACVHIRACTRISPSPVWAARSLSAGLSSPYYQDDS